MLKPEERIPCKLTDSEGYTRDKTLWGKNVTHKATGDPFQPLCTDGWIHYYEHPLIAVFMNPAHGRFQNPLLYSVLAKGERIEDGCLKSGCRELTTLDLLELPKISLEQCVEIGIRCALEVCHDQKWLTWAHKWLSREDQTKTAAVDAAAAYAVDADATAADSAAYAAADSAAYAATSAATSAAAYAAAATYAAATAAAYAAYVQTTLPLLQIIKEVLVH